MLTSIRFGGRNVSREAAFLNGLPVRIKFGFKELDLTWSVSMIRFLAKIPVVAVPLKYQACSRWSYYKS